MLTVPNQPTHLDAIEVHVERVYLLGAVVLGTHVSGIAAYVNMYRDLEVVLLLADECLVRQREVKAFVCIHPVPHRRPVGKRDVKIMIFIRFRTYLVIPND